MAIVAAAIDVANHARYDPNGLFTLRLPHWSFGGALYASGTINHDSAPSENAAVWKSVDDGATWTIQDSANAPAGTGSIANCIDGGVVYFLVSARSDQADVALRLFSFDCSTDTWTSISTTGPNAHWASGLLLRSDSSLIAIFGTFGSNDLWSVDFTGGVWGTPQDLEAVTGPDLVSYDVWSCVDEDDRSHVFFHDLDGMTFLPVNWWHVAIESDNSIGSVDSLPGLTLHGGAVAVGNNIVLGCAESGALKVLVGTPRNNPIFTLIDTIDANAPDATNLIYDPDAGVHALISLYDSQTNFLLAQSSDLSTWSSALIYDTDTDALPPNFSFGSFPIGLWYVPSGNTVLLGSNYQNSSISLFTSYYIGAFPITPVPSGALHNTFE